MSSSIEHKDPKLEQQAASGGKKRVRSGHSIIARGEPMLWLTGGSLIICVLMIISLLALVIYNGVTTFWPGAVYRFETLEIKNGEQVVRMGELTNTEMYSPQTADLEAYKALPTRVFEDILDELVENDGKVRRRLLRTGNYMLTNEHFNWVSDYMIAQGGETTPEWATVVERLEGGRFYGIPQKFTVETTVFEGDALQQFRRSFKTLSNWMWPATFFRVNHLQPFSSFYDSLDSQVDRVTASDPQTVWNEYKKYHGETRERYAQIKKLESHDVGIINARQEKARLALRKAEIDHGTDSEEYKKQKEESERIIAEAIQANAEVVEEINKLKEINEKYVMWMETPDAGRLIPIHVAEVVRAYTPNRIGTLDKFGIYFSRVWEFLSAEPREANSEGGVYPAIFGTVIMTLIMTIFVVPFGVLAALYLREYAKAGPVVSAVRIAVNNLAGVPSIVFGVFGLGFFIYIIGSGIDQSFFYANLPNPTFGKGGILWAALTLALLTLPVVIVATEEALAAVPGSMRAGSYACGASKWQTVQRIVLPRAMPGITTGAILAMARGAGEVAPLMLVGAVKLAPELPIDGTFPFIHPDRSFMHLGFHIFDLGFQSQNSEAAKPMVFTTTLLLILIILVLNLAAIVIRSRLRKKFAGSQF